MNANLPVRNRVPGKARLHQWILWACVALFGSPIAWVALRSEAFPVPGARGLAGDLWIAIPVFLLVLTSALVLTVHRWRTLESCFIFCGALAATGVALYLKVPNSGALLLTVCAVVLASEARLQRSVEAVSHRSGDAT